MEINLCVAGFGGQGVMTLGKFLAEAICNSTDKNVTFFPSYGAEQRGGTANCYVVISDKEIGAPLVNILDDLIVMNEASLVKFLPKLKKGGRLFINSSIVTKAIERDDITLIKAPASEMALQLGNPRVLNILMLGVYIGYTQIVDANIIWDSVSKKFSKKSDILEVNKNAFEQGLALGKAAR